VPKCLGAKGSWVSGSVRFPVWRHILRSGRVTRLCWCCLYADNRRQVLTFHTLRSVRCWPVSLSTLLPQGSKETAVCPGKTRTFVSACFAANFAAFVCTLTHGGVVCRTYRASYTLLAVLCCCACISYVALSLYFTSSLQCHRCLYTVILCVSLSTLIPLSPCCTHHWLQKLLGCRQDKIKTSTLSCIMISLWNWLLRSECQSKSFQRYALLAFVVYFRLLTCVIWKEIFFCFQCCCSFVLSLLLVICVTLENRSFL